MITRRPALVGLAGLALLIAATTWAVAAGPLQPGCGIIDESAVPQSALRDVTAFSPATLQAAQCLAEKASHCSGGTTAFDYSGPNGPARAVIRFTVSGGVCTASVTDTTRGAAFASGCGLDLSGNDPLYNFIHIYCAGSGADYWIKYTNAAGPGLA